MLGQSNLPAEEAGENGEEPVGWSISGVGSGDVKEPEVVILEKSEPV